MRSIVEANEEEDVGVVEKAKIEILNNQSTMKEIINTHIYDEEIFF